MESTDTIVKSPGRLRTKSTRRSTSPNESNVNLNGEDDTAELKKALEDKEDDIFDSSTEESLSGEQKSEELDEKARRESKPAKGRKRKASEMKSSDENMSDEPPTKDKPAPREDEDKMETAPEEEGSKSDDKNVSDTTSDMGMSLDMKSDTHTLGKGKRARVPNKRYSDFPLKSTRLSQSELIDELEKRPNLENGEAKDSTDHDVNLNVDLKDDLSEKSSVGSPSIALKTNSSLRANRTGSPSTPTMKKSKPTVDLSNPCYLKPFKYGWKRELVYRATSDFNTNKRNGDIYYYTPNGRKVRSMREVSENLKNKELTLDDFTFFKEPLGIDDPEKEIIRDAKMKSASSTPLMVKKSTPKVTRTPKVMSPKPAAVAESPVDSSTKAKSPRRASFKVKLPSRGGVQSKPKLEKKASKNDSDMDIGTYPPNWSSPVAKKANKTPTSLSTTDKPCRPCSIRCQGVSGIIPTLQCRICLCLYHYECVGQSPLSAIQGYVCKNCQLEQDPNTGCTSTVAPPPPLTPINALKSVHTQPTTLPKLQRIPRSNESDTDLKPTPQPVEEPPEFPPTELPRLTPRPTLLPKTTFTATSDKVTIPPLQIEKNKSIVGSVTTWFPSSSTIQVNASNNPTSISENILVAQQRPQHVEFLGTKQFLIIPKQNILAICPTFPTSATALTRNKQVDHDAQLKVAAEGSTEVASTPDSASLGPPVEVSSIKTEPVSPLKSSDPAPTPAQEPMEVQSSESDQIRDDSTAQKRPEENPDEDQEAKKKKQKVIPTSRSESETEDFKFMDSYLQNVAYGYNTLLYVFQYLKVQDLLRASCVCSMWRDIASHSMLWKTVRMKNSQIHNFGGLADALEKHGTVHLDLRKMLLPNTSGDDIWQEFTREIAKVSSLRKIELCRCPAFVVEQLPITNPKLQVINSVTIKCETMSLAPMVHVKELQELRLKSTAGFALTSDLTALSDLTYLKHLSLTSIKELNKLNIDVIADLRNLESLELGECTDFPKNFGSEILTRLTKLEKLRLEKGQGNCYTFEILEAVKNMAHLYQLELVNFDIKPGFDLALGACPNIKKLLIIPTYISQSATTNHMVLGGVLRLQSTLSQFVWGVTLELLRVTELFVDQCEEDKEKKEKRPIANGDSIPVLKPVPLAREGMAAEILPAQEPPQVEILPLPNLQKLLLSSLPTTRVKILKIPFHATWRQSIHDSVN
uniref:MBD domain-containing protein n=1 Tax=Photinus pyralis TaxID=7054 RepID=A0A1Y1KBL8_PHOPY